MQREEAKFGLATEFCGAAMKGLVLYCILLMTNFWKYQEGAGDFQPLLTASIVLLPMALSYIYCKWKDLSCTLLHAAVTALWCAFGALTVSNGIYYIIAAVVAMGESLFQKFFLGDMDARRYARRYKMQNYIKYGVMIAMISMIMLQYSNPVSEQHPISPTTCCGYMVAAFGVYVLSIILYRYMFLQYNYFRQKERVGGYAYRQLKRMNVIMAIVALFLISLAMLLADEGVVKLAEKLLAGIMEILIALGVTGLSKIKTKQLETGSKAVEVAEGNWKVQKARPAAQIPDGLIDLVIVLVVGYVLFKIYKRFAANYKTGNDEAEYIRVNDEKEKFFSTIKSTGKETGFSNNNRGKIRKLYYKMINAGIDKSTRSAVQGKTARELTEMFSKPYDRDNARKMTKIYEKARYSQEECTDQDVEEMKELSV